MSAPKARLRPSQQRRFLTALFAAKPDNLHTLLWTLPEKHSHWFQTLEDAIRFAESLRGKDLYVGVGISNKDHGFDHRCKSEEVSGIVGLWADLDLKSVAHERVALPTTVEEALEILPKELPPTFLIVTGNGVHAWWLFRESWIFETDEERQKAADLSYRWQTLIRLNAAARGWGFDRLADLARVLRVPGTQNCKDPQNLKPVEIYSHIDQHYNPSELTEFMDDRGVPDAKEQERGAAALRAKLADLPLSINPDAAVSEEILARLAASSEGFPNTWSRRRPDLGDQSQSGYDLVVCVKQNADYRGCAVHA